jgi:hypothetical protein
MVSPAGDLMPEENPPPGTQEIRATHPESFRSGQWAVLTGTLDEPDTGRECYAVRFPDGAADFWLVQNTEAGYEFRLAP